MKLKDKVLQKYLTENKKVDPESRYLNRDESTEGYVNIKGSRAFELLYEGVPVYIQRSPESGFERLYVDDMLVKHRVYSVSDLFRSRYYIKSY